MNTTNPLSLVGIRGIAENFIVFAAFGAILIVFGGATLDLSGELPKTFAKTLQEPLALITFTTMTVASLAILVTTGLIKGEHALKHFLITRIVLAFSRTGLSAGAIATGMLCGIGAALWLITLGDKSSALASNARQFLGFSVLLSLILSPLILLHLYVLYPWKEKLLKIDAATVVYVLIVILCWINETYSSNFILIFAGLSVLLGIVLAIRRTRTQ